MLVEFNCYYYFLNWSLRFGSIEERKQNAYYCTWNCIFLLLSFVRNTLSMVHILSVSFPFFVAHWRWTDFDVTVFHLGRYRKFSEANRNHQHQPIHFNTAWPVTNESLYLFVSTYVNTALMFINFVHFLAHPDLY